MKIIIKKDGNVAPTAGKDLSGYFFNGLIIITLLLFVSNLLNITLFPMLTERLLSAGTRVSEAVTGWMGGKEGRALDPETLNEMAAIVNKAVEAYQLMNN